MRKKKIRINRIVNKLKFERVDLSPDTIARIIERLEGRENPSVIERAKLEVWRARSHALPLLSTFRKYH